MWLNMLEDKNKEISDTLCRVSEYLFQKFPLDNSIPKIFLVDYKRTYLGKFYPAKNIIRLSIKRENGEFLPMETIIDSFIHEYCHAYLFSYGYPSYFRHGFTFSKINYEMYSEVIKRNGVK